MLDTVLAYYGKVDKVVVSFSKAGQSNYTLLVENATKIYQAGGCSLEKFVRTINPDMDEMQIAEEIRKIKEEQESKQEPMFNDSDYFNEGNDINDDEQASVDFGRAGNENPFDNQDGMVETDSKAKD